MATHIRKIGDVLIFERRRFEFFSGDLHFDVLEYANEFQLWQEKRFLGNHRSLRKAVLAALSTSPVTDKEDGEESPA